MILDLLIGNEINSDTLTESLNWIDSIKKFNNCFEYYANSLHSCDDSNRSFGSDIKFNPKVTPSLPASNESNVVKFDYNWLLRLCKMHIDKYAPDSILSETSLCSDIADILYKPESDIESQLVDLIGYANLDLISNLISNRTDFVKNTPKSTAIESNYNLSQPIKPDRSTNHGTTVTIKTAEQKLLEKQSQKQWKKGKFKNRSDGENDSRNELDGDFLKQARSMQLMDNATNSIKKQLKIKPKEPSYPNVYQSGTGGSHLSVFGTQFVLPVGSTREDFGDMEEVVIPVSVPAPVRTSESIVTIDMFDEWIRPSFKGYKSLNRVQSIVYPIGFHTNENMLVCAPTGAGKTDVAMLTVIRAISQHRSNGFIALDDFKIVYVAPMKALAAEIVRKFSGRLSYLGLNVRELTGDMQLTKAEINSTQMIVTTPEKWDVVTRKSIGDTQLVQKVKLLIIDEVHLLHEDRGAVIESIVARTLRLVESSQSMIRIVGLSATLPNFIDVATFLGVNPYQGLFFFDGGFRPVPLEQHFLGIKSKAGSTVFKSKMNSHCYAKVSELLRDGHQVMVFVHSRKDTVKSGQSLIEEATNLGELALFDNSEHEMYGLFQKELQKSRNRELKELFSSGIGIHHAGMLRSDRTLAERMFEKGLLKVLCCTATLAWGVNLPAYAVVIKGTQLYNAEKGSFVDLSILDVLQIFGRAGRPQFEDRGVGYIITSHDKLQHYVSSMTQQHPIESSFGKNLVNNLNAEISLGTVTNIDEAIKWLSYTYLYVRMKKNPFEYGLDWQSVEEDPHLGGKRRDLIVSAANKLHKTQMIIFDERTGYMTSKDLGRTASGFYINHNTIEIFNSLMKPDMTGADVLAMLCLSSEFENITVRQDEIIELKRLLENECEYHVKGGVDTNYGKANILLQAYISRAKIDDFALISDCGYVAQNSTRIMRALLEISINRNWGPTASEILILCKTIDRRIWSFQHPLLQFDLHQDLAYKLDQLNDGMSIEVMRDMDSTELGELVRHVRMGNVLKTFVSQFPTVKLVANVAPITRTVLKISLDVINDFVWSDKIHGKSEPFFIFVEDSENAEILYHESILLHKKQELQNLAFTIPIPQSSANVDGLPSQLVIKAMSERWLGAQTTLPVLFKDLILPEQGRALHTDLLNLSPLPITALKNPLLEAVYEQRFKYFNPVQTQIFHAVYHTKENILLGAPTGSGKTMAAELALWAAFRDAPKSKVVYIAPLKALVRERVQDWGERLMPFMGRKLVELTGDVTPDLKSIEGADVIITTPEKWDGVSRSWKTRNYVKDVSCVIIDEIHLLGGDRGPILEVIVSRMNYISAKTKNNIRIVGLSTALANATDLADWLGIGHLGLYNFRHSVRPVSLQIFIEGYPGKHYCPRMISMNKPTYAAIMTHSPAKPVIVFVSSRRQTRLTAQDLISFCANDDNPRKFLHMPENEMEQIIIPIQDQSLKMSLQFGIGLHHAGLIEKDRKIVEELFCNGKIQILVATSTLAWGVNFPAHLVVVKGTEFYDAKTRAYKDFPITDVLQMMGRAGRPQFGNTGVAVILVHDIKKNFYKKFLHEPFPVESSLHECLHEHINAEIASGTIKTKQDAMDYITWTYLYRRVSMNPSFYGCQDGSDESVSIYLSGLIEKSLETLEKADCIEIISDLEINFTPYGLIASHYYLKYTTAKLLKDRVAKGYQSRGDPDKGELLHGHFSKLLRILCDAQEFSELPVRHNEDILNRELEMNLPVPLLDKRKSPFDANSTVVHYDSPHTKSFLLLQSHLSRFNRLPSADYVTDTISVLDQSIRIMQAMIDVAVFKGYLKVTVGVIQMMQCLKQAVWPTDSSLLSLPHINSLDLEKLVYDSEQVKDISIFKKLSKDETFKLLSGIDRLTKRQITDISNVVDRIPFVTISYSIKNAQKKEGRWYVDAGEQYTIQVKVTRLKNGANSTNIRVHSPRFPKNQTEGWFLILGEDNKNELYGLKRVVPNVIGNKVNISSNIDFTAPKYLGQYDYDLFAISDGYVGVDERTVIRLYVK
ncbi:Sec63 Brl domain-containing protein [Globomyces pollinis-pini]|nr:Sec63 Brl domain-containing protein [Globomyces pollinis-pini]